MNWTEATVHVIDFEGSRRSGILEFGVATVRGGRVVETRTRLCRPRGRVSREEVRTHGIRAEEAERGEPFETEWAYFTARRRTGPFAAHFAAVENSLLKSVWPYPGNVPDFTGMAASSSDWGPWVDSGRLLPGLFEGLCGIGLSELIEAFDQTEALARLAEEHCPPDRRAYHCALYDALASALLLFVVAGYPEYRDRSLSWLLEMSAGSGRDGERLRQRRLF